MKTHGNAHSAIAANRFGLGARPGELAAIGSDAPGWLGSQLDGRRPPPAELARIAPSHEQLAAAQTLFAERRRMRAKRRAAAKAGRRSVDRSKMREFRRTQQRAYVAQAAARTLAGTSSTSTLPTRMLMIDIPCASTKYAARASPPSFVAV